MSESGTPAVGVVDFSDEKIHWDLSRAFSYADYLHLDKLLEAQHPLSDQHDEMLFIMMHQVSELWMKLALFELAEALACIRRDELGRALTVFTRVSHVQQQLLSSWDVLATISPVQFAAFRDALGKSSGFQSRQYRLLEFMLGNKNAAAIRVFQTDPASHAALQAALQQPSLYDESLRYLGRRGLGIPAGVIERDFSQPYQPNPAVEAAWLGVYRNAESDWDLYQLAERLVDLDARFQLWRSAHLKTVERVIGNQGGTGGSGGVSYLTKALDLKFFPELWALRTSM
ncbi:MAG: tryptophan 2,3-dioxygenase [Steroidobacterales bacterium]